MKILKTKAIANSNNRDASVDFASKNINRKKLQESKKLETSPLRLKRELDRALVESYIKNVFNYGREEVDEVFESEVQEFASSFTRLVDIEETISSAAEILYQPRRIAEATLDVPFEENEEAMRELKTRIGLLHENIDDFIKEDIEKAFDESKELQESLVLSFFKMEKTQELMEGEDLENLRENEDVIKGSIKQVKALLLIENMDLVLNKGTLPSTIESVVVERALKLASMA